MRRREFIAFACGAVAACPFAVKAQQPGHTYRLGFFASIPKRPPGHCRIVRRLRQNGFIVGQNPTLSRNGFNIPPKQMAWFSQTLGPVGTGRVVMRVEVLDPKRPMGRYLIGSYECQKVRK
ncbi:MAG: hypothetical protein WAM40_13515 [Xanthobacteraceae bacterium]